MCVWAWSDYIGAVHLKNRELTRYRAQAIYEVCRSQTLFLTFPRHNRNVLQNLVPCRRRQKSFFYHRIIDCIHWCVAKHDQKRVQVSKGLCIRPHSLEGTLFLVISFALRVTVDVMDGLWLGLLHSQVNVNFDAVEDKIVRREYRPDANDQPQSLNTLKVIISQISEVWPEPPSHDHLHVFVDQPVEVYRPFFRVSGFCFLSWYSGHLVMLFPCSVPVTQQPYYIPLKPSGASYSLYAI
jgi:hypothetical protein